MTYGSHNSRGPHSGVFAAAIAKLAAGALLVAGIAGAPAFAAQQPSQKTFSSATDAVHALIGAVKADDQPALLNILGADAKDLISSGDDVEDKDDRAEFVQKYQEMHRLVNEPDGNTTLYIGSENWPLPIPLVQKGGAWYFDTPHGKQEILYRRIGKNELAVIQVCHELVDAEKEYSAKTHDGGHDKQYAQKLFSDPGKHNGLYWPASTGDQESPIGPLVASAAADGYTKSPGQSPQPFQGYYFRVISIRSSNSGDPQGNDDKMESGFAFVAYPAEYRSSGVMTFFVDQNGVVYEKNLGRRTSELAKNLTRTSRDTSWRKAN